MRRDRVGGKRASGKAAGRKRVSSGRGEPGIHANASLFGRQTSESISQSGARRLHGPAGKARFCRTRIRSAHADHRHRAHHDQPDHDPAAPRSGHSAPLHDHPSAPAWHRSRTWAAARRALSTLRGDYGAEDAQPARHSDGSDARSAGSSMSTTGESSAQRKPASARRRRVSSITCGWLQVMPDR